MKSVKKLVREGAFVAEGNLELVDAEGGWAPYLSVDDACKLDEVYDALRAGDIKHAARLADRIYRLMQVDADEVGMA